MKRVLLVAAVALALPVPALAADDLSRVAATLCEYAKSNDRSGLRKKLDAADLDLRRVYDGIVCAGDGKFEGGSLLRAATAHGAMDSATFIATKIGKNGLNKAEKDGMTIVQWTEKKIGGGDAATKASLQPLLDMYKSEPQ
ncbi:MAG: DUF3718 domain-containing protein [Gammaproteobacteria bacterium]|nr:DUF3718 domain-containing protein [Gammaproteobacteria bacterium]